MQTLAQLRSGELLGTKRLQLSEGLETFPIEIYSLVDSLEILDLSHNRLSFLPDDLHRFTQLKIAFFSYNDFTEVPNVFRRCENLNMLGFKANKITKFEEDILPLSINWLILTDNKIEVLPKSIGNLSKLQKCALAGNKIKVIPEEIKNCKNLELLRLSANEIVELPSVLLSLPKLSWFAFSGNPCSKTPTFTVKEIAYDDLDIEERLGEGASGEIYKAFSKTLEKEVAFKLFKGFITSDGYALDEMSAYLSTGDHGSLIKVLAKLEGDKRLGLILELIPKDFINLGFPPNFQTCTRDTFEESVSFKAESILSIAKQISSAAAHLHDKNLMHGDLYAHNILINSEDKTYLGDFGAASFYEGKSAAYEKIEVRAFGCLLDDLLNLCAEKNTLMYKELYALSQKCLSEELSIRPLFNEMFIEQ